MKCSAYKWNCKYVEHQTKFGTELSDLIADPSVGRLRMSGSLCTLSEGKQKTNNDSIQ